MRKFTKRDFVGAARLIDRYGWLMGEYGSSRRGYCAIGALGAAKRCDPTRVENFGRQDGVHGVSLMHFNDYVASSKDDVITALLLLGEVANSNPGKAICKEDLT